MENLSNQNQIQALTLTEYLLRLEGKQQLDHAGVQILIQLFTTGKQIAAQIKQTGIVDNLGTTGQLNQYHEHVQKLDLISHQLIVNSLQFLPGMRLIVSEEAEQPVSCQSDGDYLLALDPLDGSSNLDVNISVGTIWGLFRLPGKTSLPQAKHLVAAGYLMYGSSVMSVIAINRQVMGFTLDPSIGSFVLTDPDIKLPPEGKYYSVNQAYFPQYPDYVQEYLTDLIEQQLSLRYVGSLVADVHRTLFKGGVFLYPPTDKHPQGKLRHLIEILPLSYLFHQAGGLSLALPQGQPVLDLPVTDYQQRTAPVMGSQSLVSRLIQLMS